MDAGGGTEERDASRCTNCGGGIAATHMLTRTYRLGADGRWRRRLADFAEDVVVVCSSCGEEPAGEFQAQDGEFRFIPAAGAAGDYRQEEES